MRKKIIYIVIAVIFSMILLLPQKYNIKDGGSYGYESLIYNVTFWNGRISSNEKSTGVTVTLFGTIKVYDSFTHILYD